MQTTVPDGLILVHKPEGVTSHDIVQWIRKNLHVKKVGHFGTLDPLATGLLLIALGKATRLFPFYLRFKKTYLGQIRLGFSTDTYDSEGRPTSESLTNFPDEPTLLEQMKIFVGEIEQMPPPYSAKKYKGETLYRRVRKQKEYELKPSKVTVHNFCLKGYIPPFVDFEAKCSSGTYIRSIAHDLGKKLGCGAHLNQLTRTAIGEFHVGRSHPVEEIGKMASLGQWDRFLVPMEALLPDFPKIVVNESVARRVRCGNAFTPDSAPPDAPQPGSIHDSEKPDKGPLRIFDHQGKLIAFAKKEETDKSLRPFIVFD